ncbi:hypothetical protein JCM11251_004502 [Rhodosporidiobolus azoricus]
MAPILLLSPLTSLLHSLTHPSGAPHSALLCSLPAGGAVVASAYTPTEAPFPPPALEGEDGDEGEDDDEDERASCYAALAVGSWGDHQRDNGGAGGGAKDGEPVMLETELGRIALAPLGNFLLVLVGNEVAPWKVLDKKLRIAVGRLDEPLKKVAA